MRILIISNSFFPQNSPRSFRATELAKEFSRLNHEVTVYIPVAEYNIETFLDKHPNIKIKKSIKYTNKSSKLLFGKFLYYYKIILLMFLQYPFIKYYFQLHRILKDEKNYDLLISIAYPHPIHWGVKRALKKQPDITKKWVADCGDPFMLGGYRKPFYFKYFEKFFCRRADYITIPVNEAKTGYYKEFHHKLRVIPQAFNFDEIELARYIPNSIITFAYAGRFVIGDLDPRPILNFLKDIKTNFRFVVFTNQKDLFNDYLSILGDNLVIKDFTDRLTLIKELSKMDFLLNLVVNDPTRRSSKLIDYTLSGRPILSINSRKIDKTLFMEFLSRKYTGQTIIDITESNIKVACQNFIDLKIQ